MIGRLMGIWSFVKYKGNVMNEKIFDKSVPVLTNKQLKKIENKECIFCTNIELINISTKELKAFRCDGCKHLYILGLIQQ